MLPRGGATAAPAPVRPLRAWTRLAGGPVVVEKYLAPMRTRALAERSRTNVYCFLGVSLATTYLSSQEKKARHLIPVSIRDAPMIAHVNL